MKPAIYIVTNKRNGTLYIGVTSALIKRTYEHRNGLINDFTKRYGCKQLVYYELYEDMAGDFAGKAIKGRIAKKEIGVD